MDYETEEQQVEALKEWWRENGKAVIAGVVIGVVGIGGWGMFQRHQETQAVAASDGFSRTLESIDGGDAAAVATLASTVQDDHDDTLYAAYASLAAARAAVEAGDLEAAAEQLQWVAKNAVQDDVKLIATLRLARVQAASGDPAAALELLPSTYPESFQGLIEEVRGDLLHATGDFAAARTAYGKAQESTSVADPATLGMKFDDLAASDS